MGLDQYCLVESPDIEKTDATGACGGLFPIGPSIGDRAEIGYWRKAYTVNDLICKTLQSYKDLPVDADGYREDNCVDMRMMLDEIEKILKIAKEEANKPIKSEWEHEDWVNTVEVMTKARRILQQDPEAKIYYFIWY